MFLSASHNIRYSLEYTAVTAHLLRWSSVDVINFQHLITAYGADVVPAVHSIAYTDNAQVGAQHNITTPDAAVVAFGFEVAYLLGAWDSKAQHGIDYTSAEGFGAQHAIGYALEKMMIAQHEVNLALIQTYVASQHAIDWTFLPEAWHEVNLDGWLVEAAHALAWGAIIERRHAVAYSDSPKAERWHRLEMGELGIMSAAHGIDYALAENLTGTQHRINYAGVKPRLIQAAPVVTLTLED